MSDPIILGNKLHGATVRLMSALHVERICEDELDKAAEGMVPAFEAALEHAHEQASTAWRECVAALDGWTAMLSADKDPQCPKT